MAGKCGMGEEVHIPKLKEESKFEIEGTVVFLSEPLVFSLVIYNIALPLNVVNCLLRRMV